MIEMVYLRRAGDEQFINEEYQKMIIEADHQLIERFNSQKQFFGVHRQLLYVIAMDRVFKKRFGRSPIRSEEGIIYGGLERHIIQIGDSWEFEASTN